MNILLILLRVFARPHPQATAGRPVSLQYSPDSKVAIFLLLISSSVCVMFLNFPRYSLFEYFESLHECAMQVLDYQFMPEPSIVAPTILYVPPLIYSNGYSLEVRNQIDIYG